ncbi:MADS-box transcription factor 31-like [Solanum tuberosum]|uniref:MADS-box transcription factor 31-like n=1 Tax=Solanum tuberosum TaxID=4113 RepID=UPI00073A4A8F|nr:PREDICTED: MADS-box transcription factor 31-like [Solanum tuberosum]
MEQKNSTGLQNIPLAKLDNEDTRYSSFSKRSSGLYKNASELVRECDVDLGIAISSSTGEQLVVVEARNKVCQYDDMIKEFDIIEKITNKKIRLSDQINEGWWESIDRFSIDDTMRFEAWLTFGEFTKS